MLDVLAAFVVWETGAWRHMLDHSMLPASLCSCSYTTSSWLQSQVHMLRKARILRKLLEEQRPTSGCSHKDRSTIATIAVNCHRAFLAHTHYKVKTTAFNLAHLIWHNSSKKNFGGAQKGHAMCHSSTKDKNGHWKEGYYSTQKMQVLQAYIMERETRTVFWCANPSSSTNTFPKFPYGAAKGHSSSGEFLSGPIHTAT